MKIGHGMKLLIKIIISWMIAGFILIEGIYYLGKLVRPTDTDVAFKTINAFHELPENSLEVIVYGSSRAWRGINVMEMYEKYGIGAYNYACNWQRFNTTYLFFQDSLKTQSPKVVLIETRNVNNLLTNVDMNGEIYYTSTSDIK